MILSYNDVHRTGTCQPLFRLSGVLLGPNTDGDCVGPNIDPIYTFKMEDLSIFAANIELLIATQKEERNAPFQVFAKSSWPNSTPWHHRSTAISPKNCLQYASPASPDHINEEMIAVCPTSAVLMAKRQSRLVFCISAFMWTKDEHLIRSCSLSINRVPINRLLVPELRLSFPLTFLSSRHTSRKILRTTDWSPNCNLGWHERAQRSVCFSTVSVPMVIHISQYPPSHYKVLGCQPLPSLNPSARIAWRLMVGKL